MPLIRLVFRDFQYLLSFLFCLTVFTGFFWLGYASRSKLIFLSNVLLFNFICCRLLGEKNRLVRREQELTVESKQLELADLADR